jgi:hypothetical protein
MSIDKEETTSKNNSEVEERIDEETSKNEESTEENVIDYKAELERVRVERENYKKGMLKAKSENKELKAKQTGRDDIEDGWGDEYVNQEELINKKVEEIISKKSKDIFLELTNERANEILESLSDNKDEQELIKYHYEHTINPSGNIRKDLQDAKLIANRSKLLKENSELKLSLKAKDSIRNSSLGTQVNTNKTTRDEKELKNLQEEARLTGDMKLWARVLEKRINK